MDQETADVGQQSQHFPRLLFVFALIGLGILGLARMKIEQPAPDFTLTSLNNEEVTLSQFRGYPVLINFWASVSPRINNRFKE